MNVRSETATSSELCDEIKQLEAELTAIDEQLGSVSARIELDFLDAENAPREDPGEEDTWLASAMEERPDVQDEAAFAQLRHGAGESLVPYRKVSFSPETTPISERLKDRLGSRLLRGIGFLLVAAALSGFWKVILRPVLRGEHARAQVLPMELFEATREQDLIAGREALRRFYGAASVPERISWVRGGKNLEARIRTFHAEHPVVPRDIEIFEAKRVVRDGVRFVRALIKHEGTAPEGRLVGVELTDQGARVDWELAINSQRETWLSLPESVALSAARPFRIQMECARYYNAEFTEGHWLCFRVLAPEVDKPVYAYAPRQSQLAQKLRAVVESESAEPAEVVASFVPAGDQPVDVVRQLKITDFIADDWMIPASALPLDSITSTRRLVRLN